MKGFSKGLRVRGDYCHTATDPNDLGSYDFAADDKPEKERARDMWRMVDVINTRLLVSESTPKPTLQVQRSEEHTSELQSLMRISYAVFYLQEKTPHTILTPITQDRR